MTGNLVTGIKKDIFAVSGLHDDGWCETSMRFKARPSRDVTTLQFELWLKEESTKDSSRLAITIGDDAPFECRLPHDCVTTVQVACDCDEGELVSVAVVCDNVVCDKGEDVRPLSYKLRGAHFL